MSCMKSTKIDTRHSWCSFTLWLHNLGVSRTTGWRWRKVGLIHPVYIAGRLYVSPEDVDSFTRRALSGEFKNISTLAFKNGAETDLNSSKSLVTPFRSSTSKGQKEGC